MSPEDDARGEIASLLKINPNWALGRFAKTMPYRNQADSNVSAQNPG